MRNSGMSCYQWHNATTGPYKQYSSSTWQKRVHSLRLVRLRRLNMDVSHSVYTAHCAAAISWTYMHCYNDLQTWMHSKFKRLDVAIYIYTPLQKIIARKNGEILSLRPQKVYVSFRWSGARPPFDHEINISWERVHCEDDRSCPHVQDTAGAVSMWLITGELLSRCAWHQVRMAWPPSVSQGIATTQTRLFWTHFLQIPRVRGAWQMLPHDENLPGIVAFCRVAPRTCIYIYVYVHAHVY